MITATITLTTSSFRYIYDAIGFSTWAMEESARELAGDEPCSVSVMVQQ